MKFTVFGFAFLDFFQVFLFGFLLLLLFWFVLFFSVQSGNKEEETSLETGVSVRKGTWNKVDPS